MKESYAIAFDKLELRKEQLIVTLQNQGFTTISTRKNNKWSPIEHAYHVYLAEMGSRKYCIRKLSYDPKLDDAGLQNRLRIWGLQLMEIIPIKFKAPKAINENTFPDNLTLDLLTQYWNQDRIALKAFLKNLDPKYYQKEIYKHPFAGRLSIEGMLEFFNFHIDRHIMHIEKQYEIIVR